MNNYRPVAERIMDYQPVEIPWPENDLARELKRCLDCGIPFCHASGCPLGNAIPEINSAAASGLWSAALVNLLSTSPFPEFTARVCPGLCEGSCVQGLYEASIACRQVEYQVIEKGFADGLVPPWPPKNRLKLSAGVVGSGPAGLAAAWRLNRAGLKVTVYEAAAKAGGFLRYGIPDFKLEKEVIDRRLNILEAEGVNFECGVEIGRDISCRLLRKRHDLLILALGARRPRTLDVTGRELEGIYPATEYLAAQNKAVSGEIDRVPEEMSALGRRVLVVGGGDTGSDCVGTAWRQGAREVVQVEIMPRPPLKRADCNPWPQWPKILRSTSSHEEGGDRIWSVETTGFLADGHQNRRVRAVKCRNLNRPEQDGRPLEPLTGAEFEIKADLVLLALGFTGVEDSALISELDLTIGKDGRIQRKKGGQSAENIYLCGDMATGPSLVVMAIADGLAVSNSIINEAGLNAEKKSFYACSESKNNDRSA